MSDSLFFLFIPRIVPEDHYVQLIYTFIFVMQNTEHILTYSDGVCWHLVNFLDFESVGRYVLDALPPAGFIAPISTTNNINFKYWRVYPESALPANISIKKSQQRLTCVSSRWIIFSRRSRFSRHHLHLYIICSEDMVAAWTHDFCCLKIWHIPETNSQRSSSEGRDSIGR